MDIFIKTKGYKENELSNSDLIQFIIFINMTELHLNINTGVKLREPSGLVLTQRDNEGKYKKGSNIGITINHILDFPTKPRTFFFQTIYLYSF